MLCFGIVLSRTGLIVNDNKDRMKTKLNDNSDDCSYTLVNFPFLSSKCPASPVYVVYYKPTNFASDLFFRDFREEKNKYNSHE